MALRLIQIKLPDAEHDSIFEMIEDQKFVTTWPDHRVPSQRILQLVAPAEACEAIMDKFEQRFQGNPEYHILLLPVEAALPRLPEEADTDKIPQEDTINEESEKKHRVSREELYLVGSQKSKEHNNQGRPYFVYIVCLAHFNITSNKLQNHIKDLCKKWILMMDSYSRTL